MPETNSSTDIIISGIPKTKIFKKSELDLY